MTRPLWLTLACFWLAACGGRSQSDTASPNAGSAGNAGSSGGSSAGSGNAGGAAGGSGGVAGDPGVCPALTPAAGSYCSGSQCCNYSLDVCSSSQTCCVGGKWLPSPSTSGASYDCTSFSLGNLPANGSSCLCQGVLDCFYGSCAQGGLTELRCDNSTWSVTQSACPSGTPCGPSLNCQYDELCARSDSLSGPLYACKPNACMQQGKALSCDCAAACASFESCFLSEGVFLCTCPTC